VEPSERVEGPISPELVLVDPELAARARAALPDHPWPEVPRIAVERAAGTRVGPRSSFATGFVAFGVVAAAVLVVLSVLPTPNRPTFAASGGEPPFRMQPEHPSLRGGRAPMTAQDVITARPRRPLRAGRAPGTVPETQPRPQRARSAPRRRPARSARQAPSRRGPAGVRLTRGPSFAWTPRAGARYYHALFLRNGKRLYQAETRVPRVRLPARIRFTPGLYRWIVRPVIVSGLRTRLGTPIVDATFRVDRD
jgi:hypothetical protein